jgi:hypothetical protein
VDLTSILSVIGLTGVVACIGSYIYGYVWKPVGFRPLHALGLFATIVALAQLSFAMTLGPAGLDNIRYALAFLVIAGLAQALNAVKTRSKRPDA